MPKRLVDGERLWQSDKLRNVYPARYRAEYAWLLPIALADGTFECDVHKVWATVYSYNRPDMTVDAVRNMLDEFERVKLLFRFKHEQKEWGYWVGIDEKGLLPSKEHKKRYKKGVSIPREAYKSFINSELQTCPEVVPPISREYPADIPQGLYLDCISNSICIGGGSENPLPQPSEETDNEMPKIQDKLTVLCIKHNIKPDHGKSWVWKAIDLLAKGRGSSVIERQFETWLENNEHITEKPIAMFYEHAAWPKTDRSETEQDLSWRQLLADLWLINPKPFMSNHQAEIRKLREEISDPEIVSAYRDFCSTLSEYDLNRAPEGFSLGGAWSVILAARKQQKHLAEINQMTQDAEARSRALAEQEIAEAEARRARELAEVEENL